jgi:hypothetical protein
MAKRIRRAFIRLPDILMCGVAYYVTLLQGVTFLLKITSRRIFMCICALQMFTFPQVYNTKKGENCLNKTVLHPASVMKYEIPWTSHLPIVGPKRRTKVVSAKKIRLPPVNVLCAGFKGTVFPEKNSKLSHLRDRISTSVVTVSPAMLQKIWQETQKGLSRLQWYERWSKVGTYDINTLL